MPRVYYTGKEGGVAPVRYGDRPFHYGDVVEVPSDVASYLLGRSDFETDEPEEKPKKSKKKKES